MRFQFPYILLLLIFLCSCVNLNRQLRKEEYKDVKVLYDQKIKGNKKVKTYELEEFLRQKPNRKLITQRLTPYFAIYTLGKRWHDTTKVSEDIEKLNTRYEKKIEKKDKELVKLKKQFRLAEKEKKKERIKSKIIQENEKKEKHIRTKNKKLEKKKLAYKKGNWLMRVVGEPLSVYDSSRHKRAIRQMKLYLNNEGYYDAKVSAKVENNKRKVSITYLIDEGEIHKIDSVKYITNHAIIKQIVLNKDKVLKRGNPFKINDLTTERNNIYNELRNNGFFKFQRQFISFEIDTNYVNNEKLAHIDVKILSPKGGHEQYFLKNIYVLMDIKREKQLDTTVYLHDDTHQKVHFIHKKGVKVPQKNLYSIINLHEGDLYSLEKTRQTQQYLADVDIFKFININYKQVNDSSNLLNTYISTSSFKKYQLTSEAGVNVNVDEGQGLPGPFFNVKFKDRKVFHGLEVFESNFRYSLESQVDLTNTENIISNQIIGSNISLIFPRLFFPSFIWSRKQKQNLLNYFPRTRWSFGYSETRNINFHRTLFEFQTNYLFRTSPTSRLNINLFDVNILNTRDISDFFQSYLDDLSARGSNLGESFKPGIVTSTQIGYTINDNDLTKNVKAKYYRFLFELGYSFNSQGLLFDLPHYQYIKLNTDIRHYIPISKNSTFAVRLNTGIIKRYGNTEALPFEKYFFIGGVNSIRAWQARRLGPGGYLQNNEDGILFQQPGEIIVESSLELRSKLSGIVHGAFFVDAGNIWTFAEEEARPNSQFNFQNVHETFALGSGLGLRLDFSFLIIRFDLGVKLWDPSLKDWVIKDINNTNIYNLGFGIGYPF